MTVITVADRPGIGLYPHSAARYGMGCRCLSCTDLHDAAAVSSDRRRNMQPTYRHGTVRAFKAGCVCTRCRVAANEYTHRRGGTT